MESDDPKCGIIFQIITANTNLTYIFGFHHVVLK